MKPTDFPTKFEGMWDWLLSNVKLPQAESQLHLTPVKGQEHKNNEEIV